MLLPEPAFALTSAQMEELLASLHEVMPKYRPALRARMRHLGRLGFPAGVNTGRGRAASFPASAVLRMLLAFELLEAGLPPERAIAIVRALGRNLADIAGISGFFLARPECIDLAEDHECFLLFDVAALKRLGMEPIEDDEPDQSLFTLQICHGDAELKENVRGLHRRLTIIYASRMIMAAGERLRPLGFTTKTFGEALVGWAETLEWRWPDGECS